MNIEAEKAREAVRMKKNMERHSAYYQSIEDEVKARHECASEEMLKLRRLEAEAKANQEASDRRKWGVELALIHYAGSEPAAVIAIAKRMVKYLETGK